MKGDFYRMLRVHIGWNAILFMSIFICFVVLPFRLMSAEVKDTVSASVSYFFYYNHGAHVPLKYYMSDRRKYIELASLLNSHLKDFLSGRSHLAIRIYLPPSDIVNCKAVNERSIHANMLSSYIKMKRDFRPKYFTFYFDTTQVMKNLACIKYVPRPIKQGSNRLISYTLNTQNKKWMKAAYQRYILYYGKLPIMGDAKSDAGDGNEIKRKDTVKTVVNIMSKSVTKKDTSTVISIPVVVDTCKTDRLIPQICNPKLKTMFRPLFAVKTNFVYFAGVTPELKHRDIMPNIEIELYLHNHFSINGDFIYVNKNGSGNPDKKIWGVSSVSVEPRYHLGDFSGIYFGFYGLYGQYNIKQAGENVIGQTGNLCEIGLSVGLNMQFTNYLGIELGVQCGNRNIHGNKYEYISPYYYSTMSDNSNCFKLTGLRLLLVYRIGKNINVKFDKP